MDIVKVKITKVLDVDRKEHKVVRVVIGIEENQKTVHQVIVEIRGLEQISVESCIEELRTLAINWARTWLKYPDIEVTIKNKQI